MAPCDTARRAPNVATAPRDAGGSLRVFRPFARLGVGSGKMALYRPAHQRVTHTVLRRTNRSYILAFRQTACEHAIGNLRVDD